MSAQLNQPNQTPVPTIVRVATFEDLVRHGIAMAPTSVVNGMPWSFVWSGAHITHENDDCYIVSGTCGAPSIRFNRGDLLVMMSNGWAHTISPKLIIDTCGGSLCAGATGEWLRKMGDAEAACPSVSVNSEAKPAIDVSDTHELRIKELERRVDQLERLQVRH